MESTVSLVYIVEWLNHQLKAGLPLQSLVEMRVAVPVAVEEAATPEFPLIVATDEMDPKGPGLFGLLGFASSLADAAGCRIVAHYDTDTDVITHFSLGEAAAYKGHPVKVIR